MKYKRKAEIVEAFQWDGTYGSLNKHFSDADSAFFDQGYDAGDFMTLYCLYTDNGDVLTADTELLSVWGLYYSKFVQIDEGDYIVTDANGSFGIPAHSFTQDYKEVQP